MRGGSAGDFGPFREQRRNDERADQPGRDDQESGIGLQARELGSAEIKVMKADPVEQAKQVDEIKKKYAEYFGL